MVYRGNSYTLSSMVARFIPMITARRHPVWRKIPRRHARRPLLGRPRSPPPGPVSEQRAAAQKNASARRSRAQRGGRQRWPPTHNPATGAHLSSQLERASGAGAAGCCPTRRGARRGGGGRSTTGCRSPSTCWRRVGVAEERSLVALVSSMADYRSEGEYDQTELARAGQHSNSTVLLLERRSDTPRVGELHRKADDRVVSKKIEFKGMGERDQQQLEREVSCLKRCHHAHIVTYHGAFAAEGTLHIITEYCGGGSLADRIKTHRADGAPFASARRDVAPPARRRALARPRPRPPPPRRQELKRLPHRRRYARRRRLTHREGNSPRPPSTSDAPRPCPMQA